MEQATTDGTSETQANTYVLSLSGAGLELKRDIDEQTALSIVTTVMGGAAASGTTQAPGVTARRSMNPGATIGEYLSQSGASTNVEKIVAIAAYLHEYEHRDTFTRTDIQAQLSTAREALPRNYARDFGKAVSGRYFHDVGGGLFSITNTGLDWTKAGFSGAPVRKPRPIRAGRRRRQAKNAETQAT